jgi:aminotransferase
MAGAERIAGISARAKARRLLADAGVAAVAGSAFFAEDATGANPGENLLRFCFAKKDEDLAEACRRLEAYRP